MWFTLLANLLSQNNAAAGKHNDVMAQQQQDTQARVQQNRQAANTVKNQTVSANYGKYDMSSLIGGVFGGGAKSPNGQTSMNWGNYGL
jgi:hypothetical protein